MEKGRFIEEDILLEMLGVWEGSVQKEPKAGLNSRRVEM
jgi:hypothetical protein